MATIKDVARMAGVSTTTVSHVINQTRFVAEEKVEKVWQAVEQLNYTPSTAARSLKNNQTKSIGMLVSSSTNPFFAEVVRGIEHYCYQQHYNLILCNTEGDRDKSRAYMQMLSEKRVDGLLVMCSDNDHLHFDTLASNRKIPMVVLDWGPTGPNTVKIQDNSELGGYLATRHLLELGHREIACLMGEANKPSSQQRLLGFRRALEEAGQTVNEDWLLDGHYDCESGYLLMQQLLAQTSRPTAVFMGNDLMALGAMRAIGEAGLRIPDDISLIGYDNLEISAYFSPPLTTIHQPKRRLGKLAVTTLMNAINDQPTADKVRMIDPELIVRSSVRQL